MNSPALRPWDGVWRVPRPASYIPGLYRLDQITQAIFYTSDPLSELQRHYLTRFERLAEGRAAV